MIVYECLEGVKMRKCQQFSPKIGWGEGCPGFLAIVLKFIHFCRVGPVDGGGTIRVVEERIGEGLIL